MSSFKYKNNLFKNKVKLKIIKKITKKKTRKPPLKINNFYKESLKIINNYTNKYKNNKDLINIKKIIDDGIMLEKKEIKIYNCPKYVYNYYEMKNINKYKVLYQNQIIQKIKKFEDSIQNTKHNDKNLNTTKDIKNTGTKEPLFLDKSSSNKTGRIVIQQKYNKIKFIKNSGTGTIS